MYKPIYYFFIYFGVFFHLHAYSQENLKANFDSVYTHKEQSQEEKIKNTHLLLSKTDTLSITPELGYVYHKLGLLYNSTQSYEKAIQETLKAIRIRSSFKSTNSKDLNNSLYNTFIYYKKLGERQKGQVYLDKILKNKGTDKFNFKALIELASIYMSEGDYFKALQYLEPVVLSFDIYKDHRTFILGHLSCIEAYSKMSTPHKYVEKVALHKEKIESFKEYVSPKEIADMHTNLGTIFENIHEKEKAIIHYNKALSLYIEGEYSNNIGTLYTNIAAIHSRNNEHQKAKTYYTKALKINEHPIKKADVYDNQGFYLQTDDPKKKIAYYQKAIYTALRQENTPTNISQLPSIDVFKEYTYKPDVLGYLINKASAWLEAYHIERNRTYLEYAKETLYLVDQLVSLIRLDSEVDQSKLFWINSGVDSYMLAVEVCYLLEQPEEAFYFMEKNKALLLLEHLDKRYTQQNLDIPIATLQKEKTLLKKRVTIKQQLQKEKENLELQKEFIKVDNSYVTFLDSLKNRFPAYYTIKAEPKILSLQESIRKHVTDDSYFVEYIMNTSNGYGIFCSKETTHFFKIHDVPELIQQIQFLKNKLSTPFTTKVAFKRYQDTSFVVFKKLFPFVEKQDYFDHKKLIIIPDYELHNLPFSALTINDKVTNFKLDYLLHHSETVYLHSASVFQQIHKTANTPTTGITGFAPTFFNNQNLIDLSKSEKEMKKHATFLPMSLRLKEKATKAAFISSLKNTRIIHINSHAGYTSNSTPWLQLYDDKILLDELYEVENNTNLIILDACKGAQGNQEAGEGMMSLSRGFFYSGTQSVIASHWNVNEASNNEILHTFYKELKEGKTRSKALHIAQKSYLNNHQLEQTSPYFWSAITLTGDDSPLQLAQDYFWIKTIGLILLISIVIIAMIYRKKKRLSYNR